jgi:hypothetical protein
MLAGAAAIRAIAESAATLANAERSELIVSLDHANTGDMNHSNGEGALSANSMAVRHPKLLCGRS